MKKTLSSLFVAVLFLAMSNFAFSQVDVSPNNATYANLKTAFNAINAGTHGNGAVTAIITANIAEPDSATLIGGVFTSCLIGTSGAFTVTSTLGSATNGFIGGVINLDGADNVTIDGRIGQTGSTNSLTIAYAGTLTNYTLVKIFNTATSNTVKYVNLSGLVNSTLFGRIVQIGQTSSGSVGNNSNIVENCIINGGTRGIQVFGTNQVGAATFTTNDDNIFRNNIVQNQNGIGIFIGSHVVNCEASGNTIRFTQTSMTTQTSFTGIQVQAVGNIKITGNRIYDFNLSGAPNAAYRGSISLPVVLSAPLVTPTTVVDYINNMVSVVSNASTAGFSGTCIQTQFSNTPASFANYTANVYNNTMFMGGSTSVTVANLSGAYTANIVTPIATQTYNLKYRNNIAVNRRSGGSTGAFQIAQDIDSNSNLTSVLDNNLAFANGTVANSWAAAYGSFVYPNGAIIAYKNQLCSESKEQHSMFKDVRFVSESDLHLAGPVGGDLAGAPLAAVTIDFDNASRDALYPYKGCDEGAAFKILDLGAQLEGVSNTDEIKVVLKTGACVVVSTCTGDLNGTGKFAFGDSVANGSYIIEVVSRNHIRTSSAAAVSFGAGTTSYDFRTGLSQAFGSNMIIDGGNAAFFGGEVTGDGVIDLSDGAAVDNDAFSFIAGCRVLTDINNDGVVDLSDAALPDNNAFNFVAENLQCPGTAVINAEPTEVIRKDKNLESLKTLNLGF
ncbi:MAG TPA: hypothetical protein PK536_06660 [Ignavibacteria bacterium]|nr:hypothetical protein [Ignavibacteria bacterium]HRK00298.1 hypothetical protein [Ignavibacteria bacterium]